MWVSTAEDCLSSLFAVSTGGHPSHVGYTSLGEAITEDLGDLVNDTITKTLNRNARCIMIWDLRILHSHYGFTTTNTFWAHSKFRRRDDIDDDDCELSVLHG